MVDKTKNSYTQSSIKVMIFENNDVITSSTENPWAKDIYDDGDFVVQNEF